MMLAAAGTLESKSAASFGSIASTQRSEMPALKLASASSRIASRGCEASLGRKPLDPPAPPGARVEQPVVQPVGAPLPELDLGGNQALAAPVRRARRRLAVAAFCLRRGVLEERPAGDARGLGGGPGGEAAARRTGGEVGVGLGRARLFRRAVDAHLALELRPQEDQRGGAVRGELGRLAAAIVRIEN